MLLLLLSLSSCTGLKKTAATEYKDVDNSIINEPKTMNILAYAISGAILISSISSAYYHRERLRNGNRRVNNA